MNGIEQKQKIKKFVEYWSNAKGSEDSECQQFWIDFCKDLLGIENTSKVLDFEKKVRGKSIDVFLENEGILIEQKSRGIDLDQKIPHGNKFLTPYEQAKEYMFLLPRSLKPYWIITCNFDIFRIYNMDDENPSESMVEIKLSELELNLRFFEIFTKKERTKLYKEEQLSYEAGEIVGKLYDGISKCYHNLDTDKNEHKSLNILITRLVFLLYAEDSGLLQEKDAFLNYMRSIPASRFHVALKDLFKTLNTPEDQRDEYLEEDLKRFPYINGGLFSDDNIIIPPFNETIKTELLLDASQQFDWAGISPTIFGAVFESTLNPETRRSGGMHYTSVENIHKVIDPLFLDDLKAELSEIEGERVAKTRDVKLKNFQNKLASIRVLDPAAGSHNFLTETYISLRKLEIRVIENLQGDQFSIIENPIKVKIDQLYAIEINDFAVSVGKAALWIAEQQMMELTQEILPNHVFEFFPIKNVPNSVCANALRIDWNDVLPAQDCTYIIGNPPFYGARLMNKEQKTDVQTIFGEKWKGVGNLDYVTCWYKKSADFMKGTNIKTALVSTNSICQGEQVAILWKNIFAEGIVINFAHKTFVWQNEANNKAHVHCVIIGFSYETSNKYFIFNDSNITQAKHINPYLCDADNVFIENRTNSLCITAPQARSGNKPIDNGYYLFDDPEKNDFIIKEHQAEKLFRRWYGSNEFINNVIRWCLWVGDCTPEEINKMPHVKERVDAVREFRLNSKSSGTVKLADKPTRFHVETIPNSEYLILPLTSSERRKYVPIGFMQPPALPSNLVTVIQDVNKYHFGILTSSVFMSWMRIVCGRLESRYRITKDNVYNNFPWPGVTKENIEVPVEDVVSPEIKEKIENCAQIILDTRDKYPDSSLAQLYDPDKMPEDLKQAHLNLDRTVEEAYGVNFNGDEEKIVAHLFNLYNNLTGN